jgi:predicted ester cyclase
MTSKLDVIRAWHDALYANPPSSIVEANQKFLSDDFKNLDKDGTVLMDKQAYLGMAQLLSAAMKDIKWVIDDLREEGDGVVIRSHFEGTHTGDFDLSAMGLGVVPASGKKIVWPDSSARFTIEGDKVLSIKEIDGGVELFLAPLGVKLPSA